jgi:hypothetical protein
MNSIRSPLLSLIFNKNINKRKLTYTWKLKIFYSMITWSRKKESKDFLVFNENEATHTQTYGHNKSSPNGKTYSSVCLQKEYGESIHEHLDSICKSSRIKGSNFAKEE